jgi:SAM-dependent methyltransferase
MKRVLRPDGRLLIAVWDKLERSPGYHAMVALLDRLFGARVADALRAPFVLGDIDVLRSTFAASGLNGARIETLDLNARFPSLEAWVQTDVKAWTLADMIDDAQYQTLLRAARRELTQFQCSDRSVAFSAPAHLVTIAD